MASVRPAASSEAVLHGPVLLPKHTADYSQQAPNQPRPYPGGNYMPNGAPNTASGPAPGAVPLLPNQGRVIQQGSVRVLCVADVRGESSMTYLVGDKLT